MGPKGCEIPNGYLCDFFEDQEWKAEGSKKTIRRKRYPPKKETLTTKTEQQRLLNDTDRNTDK
jgi:hypothetical protein